MTADRPNPDVLLVRVQQEEARAGRGRLRIFFGYAAGVGKTFGMLTAARRERDHGLDVVVGYVEPHGRPETEALLQAMETLPTRGVPYRGVTLREFDLDAALARRPQLLLVDELAHTNAEGLRHAKRWQDVEELLEAGIDVWTTLNVQHIESLNDVIAQITGVVVRETLPDAVLEQADEIELVDVTPEELMERLKAGKVYLPTQVERALSNFFQRGNLVALRELSLRQAAHRLQRDVEAARKDRSAAVPWATTERLLVCIGPSPSSLKVIRAAKRMATALGAEWLAVAVNTGRAGGNSSGPGDQTAQHLRMAEQLGAETHVLVGNSVSDLLLDFARSRNVTKIVIGKSAQPRWKRSFVRTVVDQLIDGSGEIDVYVVTGEGEAPPSRPAPREAKPVRWRDYLAASIVVATCALIGSGFHLLKLADANIMMVFLTGVVIVAARLGRGPAVFGAVASVLVFDFFFVNPYLTFAVSDSEYLITFAVMLGIGLFVTALTSRVKAQLTASQQQEKRTADLFRMTRQLSELTGTEFLVRTAGKQLSELFPGEIVILLREPDGKLMLRYGEGTSVAQNPINLVVAEWVADNNKTAGTGTDTLPNATALFLPLLGSQRTVGALGARPTDADRFQDPEQRRLLETCASLIALSIERDESVLSAHQSQLQVESEQLRNSLLSSVSHDLRTPLATIAGTASSLIDSAAGDDPQVHREMLQTLVDESSRLSRLVDNLLDMARLDSGTVMLNRQWHVLEELVGLALRDVKRELDGRRVQVQIPNDFPLLHIDGFLMEQVLINLLENASRYTPRDAHIDILAARLGNQLEIRVRDNGPGLPPGSEAKIFDKFFRGTTVSADGRRGVGLGLAICRAVIHAHSGRITAGNRAGGGAEFLISLPYEEQPPRVAVEGIPVSASA